MTAAAATGTEGNDSKSRSLVGSAFDTAHKVALAGVGAAGEVVDAGARVFDRLVARGEKAENQGRESLGDLQGKAEEKVQQVRSAAEGRFQRTRARAEAGIDEHLERRLERLGVPGKAALEEVLDRLGAIEARLDALEKPKPRRRTAKKPAAARTE